MIIDLFAGLGGWDHGLALCGRTDVIGFELDPHACASRAAAGLLTVRADISAVPLAPLAGRVEGLIASPPCQTFSNAGKGEGVGHLEALVAFIRSLEATGWRPPPDDAPWDRIKTGLVLEPLRWAWELRPTWVACEQVPPVLPVWQATARCLAAWGWNTWTGVLSSERYGVPQTRKRAILMAHADRPVHPPEPTHQEYVPGVPARGEEGLFGSVLPWVSMAEALGWGMTAKPYLTVTGGHCEESFLASNPSRDSVELERDEGRWVDGARVGFGRRDDLGTSDDGLRERDFRDANEPAFALTEKARNWTVSTGGNAGYTERDDGTRDYGAFERPVTDPAPTVDAKAPGAWKVGEPGHRDDPEARPGRANAARVRTSNFTAVARDPDGRRTSAGSVPYERDTAEPSPTLTGDAGSWEVLDGEAVPGAERLAGMFEIQPHGARRHADEPAMTIPGAADNGNYRFATDPAQVEAAQRPAPTIVTSRRSSEGGIVGRQLPAGHGLNPGGSPQAAPPEPEDDPDRLELDGMREGAQWSRRRPATTITSDPRLAPPDHHGNDGRQSGGARPAFEDEAEREPGLAGTRVEADVADYKDWAQDRPSTTLASRDLAPDPGENANRFNGATKSRNDGIRIAVEDALVLQGFGRAVPVRGTKTAQFLQVGNAFPPPVAAAVLRALL